MDFSLTDDAFFENMFSDLSETAEISATQLLTISTQELYKSENTTLKTQVSYAMADLCAYVLTKDCAFIPDLVKVCGTNGVTYRNSCFFAKEYCVDNTIHKAHDGPCAEPTTTPAPVHGSEIALDIFCLDLIYITCPTGGTRVCGSDGKYYENVCEFDKARCFHRDLTDGTNCV